MNDGQTRAAGDLCGSSLPFIPWDVPLPAPPRGWAGNLVRGPAGTCMRPPWSPRMPMGHCRAQRSVEGSGLGMGRGDPGPCFPVQTCACQRQAAGWGATGDASWLQVPQAGHLQPRVDSCPPCLRPWWPWTLDTAPRAGGPAGPVQHRGERPEQPGWGAASSGSLSSGSRKHGGSGEAELEACLGPGLRAGEPWSTPPCAEVLAAPWEGSPGAR